LIFEKKANFLFDFQKTTGKAAIRQDERGREMTG
jgi:hypothetical protein